MRTLGLVARWLGRLAYVVVLALIVTVAMGCRPTAPVTGPRDLRADEEFLIPACEPSGQTLPYLHVSGDSPDATWFARQLSSFSDGILTLCKDEGSPGFAISIESRIEFDADGTALPPARWEQVITEVTKLRESVKDGRKRQHYEDVLFCVLSASMHEGFFGFS